MTRTVAAQRALLLAAAGVVALAALLAWVTLATPEHGGIDARVFELATSSELPGGSSVLSAFSSATNTAPLLIATVIVGLGAWIAGARRATAAFWGASAFSSLSVTILKRFTDRTRPPLGEVVESSRAWPSGHAAGSLIFASGVALVVWTVHRQWWTALGLVPLALGVGYSRVFLGLHWATDVMGGWLVATVAAALLAVFTMGSAVEQADRRAVRIGWLYGAIAAAVGFLIVVGVTAPPIT